MSDKEALGEQPQPQESLKEEQQIDIERPQDDYVEKEEQQLAMPSGDPQTSQLTEVPQIS